MHHWANTHRDGIAMREWEIQTGFSMENRRNNCAQRFTNKFTLSSKANYKLASKSRVDYTVQSALTRWFWIHRLLHALKIITDANLKIQKQGSIGVSGGEWGSWVGKCGSTSNSRLPTIFETAYNLNRHMDFTRREIFQTALMNKRLFQFFICSPTTNGTFEFY